MQPNPPAQIVTALSVSEPTVLTEYLHRPEVAEQFRVVLGNSREAMGYIQSVIILVQNSEPGTYSLQSCSLNSVVRSALRAATLKVSVDPALRQAYLVPRKNTKTGKIEANLQLHYNEIRNRAMRTNRYLFINVSPVYEGQEVLENIYTGQHRIKLANGLITAPQETDGLRPVRERFGKIIGWLGYYQTTRRAEMTVYMSVEDIIKHVTQHNSSWTSSKAWRENRQAMEQKTVLLALLRKADLGAPDMAVVKEALQDIEAVEEAGEGDEITGQFEAEPELKQPTETTPPAAAPAEISPAEAAYIQACEVTLSNGTSYGKLDDAKLKIIAAAQDAPAEKKKAAQIILDHRAASLEKNIKDLGF